MSKTVTVSVPAPQSAVDACQALDSLVEGLVGKKPVGALAASELETLVAEYGDLQNLPTDVAASTDQVEDLALLYGRRIVYRLLGKPVTPPTIS